MTPLTVATPIITGASAVSPAVAGTAAVPTPTLPVGPGWSTTRGWGSGSDFLPSRLFEYGPARTVYPDVKGNTAADGLGSVVEVICTRLAGRVPRRHGSRPPTELDSMVTMFVGTVALYVGAYWKRIVLARS